MQINFKHEVFIKDSLYNCSTECTRTATWDSVQGLKSSQIYGQGIINGMVSILMAQGMLFEDALATVKHYLPRSFDADCMPKAWR